MASLRAVALVTASLTAPTLVLEPHLRSGPDRGQLQEYEERRLSQLGVAGSRVYNENCMSCHGDKGVGTSQAPSLRVVAGGRKAYQAKSFHNAVRGGNGTSGSKHGTMLTASLSFNDIEKVARYVREIDRLERSIE